jgi:hypothetical protein
LSVGVVQLRHRGLFENFRKSSGICPAGAPSQRLFQVFPA